MQPEAAADEAPASMGWNDFLEAFAVSHLPLLDQGGQGEGRGGPEGGGRRRR